MNAAVDNVDLPSRRDAGKAHTRQALIDAALFLFSTGGYEQTTAEAVAERAGVSARTFFRHFTTKESVLFFGEDDFYHLFVNALAEQPASAGELAAISAAFVSMAPSVERVRDRVRQYRLAIATSSTLRGREQSYRDNRVAYIAKAVTRRRGLRRTDNSCRVVATVAMTVFELAITDWVAGSARTRLTTVVGDRFRLLEAMA